MASSTRAFSLVAWDPFRSPECYASVPAFAFDAFLQADGLTSISVECTTCGARLKIRDASLGGQIIACPKCGGMVQVGTPEPEPTSDSFVEQIEVGVDADADSQAATQGSIERSRQIENRSEATDTPVPPLTHRSRFLDPDAESNSPHDEPVEPAAGVPLDPNTYAQSAAANRRRQLGLVAVVSFVGLVAAGLVFGSFVRWWQTREVAAEVTRPADSEQTANASDAEAPTAKGPADQANAETPDVAKPSRASATDGHSVQDPDRGQFDDRPEVESLGEGPGAPSVTGVDAATGAAPGTAPSSTTAGSSTESSTEATNPDDNLDQSSADQIAAEMIGEPILGDEAAEDDEDAEAGITELPEEMKRWTQILSFDEPSESDVSAAPPTIEQLDLEGPAAQDPSLVDAIEEIDLERQLKRRFAIDPRPAPLIRWLNLLSQLSGAPIALDVVSLDAAGIDPLQSVTPPGGWNRVDEILKGVLAEVDCQAKIEPPVILVAAVDPAIRDGVQPALQIDDLQTVATDREAFVAQLSRVAGCAVAAPAAGQPLQIDEPVGQVWRVALVAEALRLARGKPPRLPRSRTRRWLVNRDNVTWPQMQQGQAIAPVDHPLALVDLLHRLAEVNDAQPWFQWFDALQQGAGPGTEAMPWLIDATAQEAIEQAFAPYKLEVRQAGSGLWWIGRRATYDRSEVIAFLPCPADQQETRLQQLSVALGIADPNDLPAFFDPASNHLILRGPRFLIRQL